MSGFEVLPGDIIVSCAGTIGETYIMPDDIEQGIINQALMRVISFITPEWIEWASKKADWYDPTKDVEDEYLGKRDHGKNREEKDLDKIPVKRSWYW